MCRANTRRMQALRERCPRTVRVNRPHNFASEPGRTSVRCIWFFWDVPQRSARTAWNEVDIFRVRRCCARATAVDAAKDCFKSVGKYFLAIPHAESDGRLYGFVSISFGGRGGTAASNSTKTSIVGISLWSHGAGLDGRFAFVKVRCAIRHYDAHVEMGRAAQSLAARATVRTRHVRRVCGESFLIFPLPVHALVRVPQ